MSKQQVDNEADRQLLDSLVMIWEAKIRIEPRTNDSVTRKFYHFNPNTASPQKLLALGFSETTVSRIIRYREKGGHFRIKTDLLKIYGIDSAFYHQIHSFVDIPERKTSLKVLKKYPTTEKILAKAVDKFDINTADTAQLKKIYGIGDKLSMRILKYRNALGGFVSMNQLKEVYGLDSLVIKRLEKSSVITQDFEPTKININVAMERELAAHPYLSKVAKAIVSYRFQHGTFKSVSEIRNISALDGDTIQKIIPYLKTNDEL